MVHLSFQILVLGISSKDFFPCMQFPDWVGDTPEDVHLEDRVKYLHIIVVKVCYLAAVQGRLFPSDKIQYFVVSLDMTYGNIAKSK